VSSVVSPVVRTVATPVVSHVATPVVRTHVSTPVVSHVTPAVYSGVHGISSVYGHYYGKREAEAEPYYVRSLYSGYSGYPYVNTYSGHVYNHGVFPYAHGYNGHFYG